MIPPLSSCHCGAWVSWGSLASPDEVAAWLAAHASCEARPVEPTQMHIKFATEAEAIEFARILRPTHFVGRLNAGLLVRPRKIDPSPWTSP